MERGDGWQCSSICCGMLKLHWDENSQVSSFSLAGPYVPVLDRCMCLPFREQKIRTLVRTCPNIFSFCAPDVGLCMNDNFLLSRFALLTNQIALLLLVRIRGWTEFGKMFGSDCRRFLFYPPHPTASDSRLHNYPWLTVKHSVNIRQPGKNSPIIPPSPPLACVPHLSSCWPNSLSVLTSSVSWGIFPRRSQTIKIDVGDQSISIHSLGLWLQDCDINR